MSLHSLISVFQTQFGSMLPPSSSFQVQVMASVVEQPKRLEPEGEKEQDEKLDPLGCFATTTGLERRLRSYTAIQESWHRERRWEFGCSERLGPWPSVPSSSLSRQSVLFFLLSILITCRVDKLVSQLSSPSTSNQ